MSIISNDNILKVLMSYNPWWNTGVISEAFTKKYKRLAYYDTYSMIKNEKIRRSVVLTGTRRVGKTTILYQLINQLILDGVEPQKIVFISMDHPMLKLSNFQEVISIYHSNIYAEQDVYYFFDEIQYMEDWDRWLKVIYDMQPLTKIIATGSASPVLISGSRESGAGRWTLIEVPTLTFFEYCSLLEVEEPYIDKDFTISSLLELSNQNRVLFMSKLSHINNHFLRYLQVGGFPELALSDDDLFSIQILREDVVDKVLKRDLPALYNIRNTTELERIFLYLCNVSSEVVSIETISKELKGASKPTVDNYIKYLESASLIYISWPVDNNGKKILKSSPKIYIVDSAIRNSVLLDTNIIANSVEMGKIVETAIFKHVSNFYFQKSTLVGYLRTTKKDKEVDIVVDLPNSRNVFIEVKYRNSAPIPDDSTIVEVSNNDCLSIIITKNIDDFGVHDTPSGLKLLRIPAFAFLYLIGILEKNKKPNL